jgi:hypothetical protein
MVHQSNDAEIFSFADTMRKMVDRLLIDLGYDGDQINLIKAQRKEEPLQRTLGASYRQLMRTLGTEWGRDCIHPEIWVHVMMERLNTARRLGRSLIVIDDLRFENEYRMIQVLDGQCWRVERPGVSDADTSGHRSDGGLEHVDDWDRVVSNTGSLEDLEREINAWRLVAKPILLAGPSC